MPAFKLAEAMHADGIETDIQLTKDGIPVLIHDETLKRTTGAKGFVKDYDLTAIKKLDAGKFFSETFVGSEILTLEEFLEWAITNDLTLNLELKTNKVDYENIEEKSIALINKYNLNKRVVLSSFNSKTVKKARAIDNEMDIAYLRSKKRKNLAQFAVDIGASSLHINYRLLNAKLVEECQELQLPLRVYTVNRRTAIFKSLKYKCAALITDVPDKAIKIRNAFQRKTR